jgi:FkbM family methyltransferase
VQATLGIQARTYAYRAVTNVDAARLRALRAGTLSRVPFALGERVLRRGSVAVAEGPARGLLLSARDLPLDHVQGFGLVRGLLEVPVQEALRRAVAEDGVVFDVGANLGFFSLLAARLAGPGGRVEAFEPVPESAEAARGNAALNGLDQIRVHQVAVGERAGTGELLLTGEVSWSHLADRGWHSDTRALVEVETVCLDEQVTSGALPAPDVIKIDVEGSELAVLRGATEILRAHRPAVICELHETNREFAELMGEAGYEVVNLEGAVPVSEAGATRVLARSVTA